MPLDEALLTLNQLAALAADAEAEGVSMFSIRVEVILHRGRANFQYTIGSNSYDNAQGHSFEHTAEEFLRRAHWHCRLPPPIQRILPPSLPRGPRSDRD